MTGSNHPPVFRHKKKTWLRVRQCWELYLFLLPAVALVFIFSYIPMYGISIAFKNYKPSTGYAGSEWVGLMHFIRLFTLPKFKVIVSNTFIISFMSIVLGFPFPVMLSLILNQLRSERYKRIIQTVTYMPHFISTVVIVSMLTVFLSTKYGIYRYFCDLMGAQPVNLMGSTTLFRWLYVFSGIWQHTGWNTIIYLAALTGISPELYEAAEVDGASRLRKIWHITLPGIRSTIIVLLIMNLGHILGSEFDRPFTLSNPLVTEASKTISIYVYEKGINGQQYALTTAVGLFQSVICVIFLLLSNSLAKKFGERGIW